MSYFPIPVPGFGGLNLADDPGDLGFGGAVDMLNVDLDRQGRVRSRDGYSKFNVADPASPLLWLLSWDSNGQLLALDGANLRAYDVSTGTLVASGTAIGYRTGAAIGTASAGYFYLAVDHNNQIIRWDGATMTSPGGMPNAACLAVQPTENRLVAADTSAAQRGRVKFSDPGAPETWGANNFVDLHPNDGESIEALVAWRDLLFAFKQRKFYVFYGNSTDSTGNPIFNYRTVATGKGVGSIYAAVAGPDAVYFVNATGIYRTTGGPPERMPGLDALFAAGSSFFQSSATYSSATQPFTAGDRVCFPITLSSGNSFLFIWDTVYRSWTVWQMNNATHFTAIRLGIGDFKDTIVFSYPSGTNSIGKIVSSATDDAGTAITSRYQSGFENLAPPRRYIDKYGFGPSRKRIRAWRVEGSGTVTMSVAADFGAATGATALTLGTAPAVAEARYARAIRGSKISYKFSGSSAWSVNDMVAFLADTRGVAEDISGDQ